MDYEIPQKMTDEQIRAKSEALYTIVQKLDPVLARYGLAKHTAQVVLALDASGSMSDFYQSGKVQRLVERMLPFAIRFDDNATIDAWLFSRHVSQLHEITPDNFEGCVDRMRWNQYMGSTDYVKMLDAIVSHFGTETPRQYPVYVIFVTDGAPDNKVAATRKIEEMAKYGIFVQFVAIGEDWPRIESPKPKGFWSGLFSGGSDSGPRTLGMQYLVSLDEDLDTEVDSVNAFAVTDPVTIDESALYDLMCREYPTWLPLARNAGLIQ